MLLKKAKQSWKDSFDKMLSSSEKKETSKVKRYYESQYKIAIDDFVKTKKIKNYEYLFSASEFFDLYSSIYVNIGLKFAKSYAKNFDNVVQKQTDVSNYDSIWKDRFNQVSREIAGERVTLVRGTAKETLKKVLKQLSSDPEFMAMNEREASRILRSKFSQYSDFQAKRLVRTEATNAANVATLQGATDMFGEDNLQKEWMTAIDGRERAAHREADGQIVDYKEKFFVGGQFLFSPGDPSGNPKNVINCRCSTAPFPKEDAVAIAQIEGFGVRDIDAPSTTTVLRTPKPVREQITQTVNVLPDVKTIKEGKQVAQKILTDAGLKIQSITVSSSLDIETFNQYLKEIYRLTNKYKIDSIANTQQPVRLIFKSNKSFYGFVTRTQRFNEKNYNLKRINFGDITNENQKREIFNDKFQRLSKSPVDIQNEKIGTLTHEFAHIIASSENPIDADFFSELKVIYKDYKDRRIIYAGNKNFKAFNEINLGSYASTEIDEFLAEGFKEYELMSKPSKYAKLIGELVTKYYKK